MSRYYRPQYYWVPRQQTITHSDGRKVAITRFGSRDWTRTTTHPDGRKSVVRSNSYGSMTKVVGVLMVLVAPAAYLGVFSIPVYLSATFLFALWLIHRTKAQQGGTLRAARPTATGKRAPVMSLPTPNLPPGISPTERIGELNFAEAYERTAEELRQMLFTVANHESAESFVEEAVRKLRATAAATPEFYIGEFYARFQKAMRDDAKAEIASCDTETEQITTGGKGATADLNARLDIARTAGDQDVEHAIWREGEQRKAEYQAAIDGLTDRLNLGTWRLRAVDALGLALGGQRKSADERSQAATTVNDRSSRSERNPSIGPVETTVRDGITPGASCRPRPGAGNSLSPRSVPRVPFFFSAAGRPER